MDEDKEKENNKEENNEENKEEEEKEKKEKEKKKERRKEIIDETPFRQGFETSAEHTALISEPEREIRGQKLEDSLASVEIKKPFEEKEKEKREFQYAPVYEEKNNQKYITTRTEIFEARKTDFEPVTTAPIREIRELKNPLAREVKISHGRYDEVIKYEKAEREDDTPVTFGPEFKYPEKKIKKYKTKY